MKKTPQKQLAMPHRVTHTCPEMFLLPHCRHRPRVTLSVHTLMWEISHALGVISDYFPHSLATSKGSFSSEF